MKSFIKLILLTVISSITSIGFINSNTITGSNKEIYPEIRMGLYNVISITENTALNFGKILAGSTESVVSLASDGTASVTSGNAVHQGQQAIGEFTLTGDANQPFRNLRVVATGTLTNGTTTLNTTYSIQGTPPTTLDATGNATFNVIGTVTIPANTQGGNYTGTYEVTFFY